MAKIIIVDDDQQNRYLLKALLGGHGHEVLSAANGQEALGLARSNPVELIITDILMPVKDGFALCREWKTDEDLGRIPLIFYSATYTDQKDIDFGLSLGADLFLIKPLEPAELMAAIEAVLKKKAAPKEPDLKPEGRSVFLQEYNQALIRKLEKKMLQLEAEVGSRRNTEIQLLRFKTAIENADEAILLIDAQGLVEYVNPAFEQTTGFSRDEVLGRPPAYLEMEKNGSDQAGTIWETVNQGRAWRGHLTKKTRAGEGLELDVTVSPIPDESGGKGGYVSVLRDVTQQMIMKTRFSQSQKMEAIGTLAGGVAHDFNNILGVVIGNAELALDMIENRQDPTEKIGQILTAGTRAGRLVNQILNFSRQTEQEMKPISLCHPIRETLKFIRSSLPATVEINHDLRNQEDIVMADATQLQQVLMNLCTNAAHAMRQSGGVLYVGLKTIEMGQDECFGYPNLKLGRYQRLTVTDTGHGMDQDIMTKIFDPFFTTKEIGEGTGLGLSVAHGIVSSHRGAITVYSEVGVGTTFHVYLPLSQHDRQAQDPSPEQSLAQGSEHILFVDDEKALTDLGREMLTCQGYNVTGLTSSQEAIDLFRSQPGEYDLIITDHIMPHLTGLELARKLLDIRPDLPVILCSGFRDNKLTEEATGQGIKRVLTKPFRKAELLRAVREVLDG